ncbi:alpha/beta hydrolase family protein [Roseateles sp.]|uniref:alpha/beta hydrolase family protein n=1 Tax=Roseateles sp. TaxID=1971397 RepID=UPI002DFE9219|nr:prolyl oligopeptidase family serine peptidase [Roseateles sp.]HEV6964976.1 prolyl oligopeptidase family serine peptidase [Roseateles sp.]
MLATWAAFAQGATPAQTPKPIPIETFFKPAELQSAQLSPSGRYLAALRGGVTERVGFLIVDLEGKEGSHFISAGPRDDVDWFSWVSDDWLAFGVNDPAYRGRGSIGRGLSSMSRDGKTSRQLIGRDWYKGKERDVFRRTVLTPDYYYIGRGAPGSQEVLVGKAHFNDKGEYEDSSLYALDVVTGQPRLIATAPRAEAWRLDGRGQPRVAIQTKEGQTTILWLDPRSGQWTEVLKAPSLEMPWWPLAVRDDLTLLVTTTDALGYHEVREYAADKRQLAGRPLLTTPGFDSSLVPLFEQETASLLGLRVLVDAWTTSWLDPTMADIQTRVDTKLPGRVNAIACSRSCLHGKRYVVYSSTDTDPGMTLLFSPADDQWQMVGRVRPDVDPQRMSPLQLHRIKARDGHDLPVWITRPRGQDDSRPAAAIVLVHGGPWVRGVHWRWGSERQFLASRGYVVIEPEFRGSTGYGDHHFKDGFKQWGLTMQDDVSDGLKFAVDKGWVDAKRVCIMGGSYGGYASLMGIVKDPDQYRCAVAFAAVSDPRFMFDFFWSDISDEAKVYSLPETLGDRVKDDAKLAASSPLMLASRIKAPVLLVHGEQDVRVPIQNGERMRDALQKNGKSVEWVTYPRAYHGFPLLEDELDYYGRVERFLAKHLN